MLNNVYNNKNIDGTVHPTPQGYVIDYNDGYSEEFRYIENTSTYSTYGLFTVSNQGRVKNEAKQQFLVPRVIAGEYRVRLFDKRGRPYYVSVAELTAMAFLGGKTTDLRVIHKNNNLLDNHVENLEWRSRYISHLPLTHDE